MREKILVPCLDVIMIAFSSLVLEIWSFTVYFSGKRRSLSHPNTAQGSFFPYQSYSKETLRTNVPKSARKYKRNVLMPQSRCTIFTAFPQSSVVYAVSLCTRQ